MTARWTPETRGGAIDLRYDKVLPTGETVYGRRGFEGGLGDVSPTFKVIAWTSVAVLVGGGLLLWLASRSGDEEGDYQIDDYDDSYQIDEEKIVSVRARR